METPGNQRYSGTSPCNHIIIIMVTFTGWKKRVAKSSSPQVCQLCCEVSLPSNKADYYYYHCYYYCYHIFTGKRCSLWCCTACFLAGKWGLVCHTLLKMPKVSRSIKFGLHQRQSQSHSQKHRAIQSSENQTNRVGSRTPILLMTPLLTIWKRKQKNKPLLMFNFEPWD